MITELKWYSVNELLPGEYKQVLALKKDGTFCVARIRKGITIAEREKMKSGKLPFQCISIQGKDVPRWQIEEFCDEHTYNFKPYSWFTGIHEEPGNVITHWAELSKENLSQPHIPRLMHVTLSE